MVARSGSIVRVVLSVWIVLLAGGCASAFDKAWRAAAAEQQQVEPTDIAGRWKGRWKSEASGHGGGLRAVVRRADAETYDAHFHATYAAILQFAYRMQMRAPATQPAENMIQFTGEADLGKMAGGVYRYEGQVTPTRFHCTYTAKDDRGYFEMNRP